MRSKIWGPGHCLAAWPTFIPSKESQIGEIAVLPRDATSSDSCQGPASDARTCRSMTRGARLRVDNTYMAKCNK